jgi:hypothetical protein
LVRRTDHKGPRFVVFSTPLFPQPLLLPQFERPNSTPIQNTSQNYGTLHCYCFLQEFTQFGLFLSGGEH